MTKEHLISPLLTDDAEALTLWCAISNSKKRLKDVLEFIGHDMINKTTDPRLNRDRRSSLASILVWESLMPYGKDKNLRLRKAAFSK